MARMLWIMHVRILILHLLTCSIPCSSDILYACDRSAQPSKVSIMILISVNQLLP